MKRKGKLPFDPRRFLAKVGKGKTVSKYRKDQIVFSQGQVADAVFYIQQGKVKLPVVSEQGKEAVVAILEPGQFFGEGCLNFISPPASQKDSRCGNSASSLRLWATFAHLVGSTLSARTRTHLVFARRKI
jgi:Cyclic nucleotide-binding domain